MLPDSFGSYGFMLLVSIIEIMSFSNLAVKVYKCITMAKF